MNHSIVERERKGEYGGFEILEEAAPLAGASCRQRVRVCA